MNDRFHNVESVTITGLCEWSLTFTVELPWPAKELSPNARQHWAAAARARKAYRARCRAIGEASGLCLVPKAAQAVKVHMTFVPPDRRKRDWDNLVASMKSGLDGVSDAMGVDDSRWRLSFDVCDDALPGGLVMLTVSEVTP